MLNVINRRAPLLKSHRILLRIKCRLYLSSCPLIVQAVFIDRPLYWLIHFVSIVRVQVAIQLML